MTRLDPTLWRDLVGLPFKHHGRGPDAYDCYGLALEIFRRRGITIPDIIYDEDLRDQERLLEAADGWKQVPCAPGAGVMFRRLTGSAAHVGVMIDDDLFIHATEDHGQVMLSRLSRNFSKRLVGFYDYAV